MGHTKMRQRMGLGFVSVPIPIGKGKKLTKKKRGFATKKRRLKLGKGVFDRSF